MKKYVKCKMVILLMACTLVLAGCEAADASVESGTETVAESTEDTETESLETESQEAESTEEDTETESLEMESTVEASKTESTEETGTVNKKATAAKSAGTGANVSANAKADGTGETNLADGGVSKGSGSGGYIVYLSVAENGFRKDVAQEIWNLVNEERTAAGLNALEWDDSIYEFACSRAKKIVTDFSHNGSGMYGENILMNYTTDANTLHMQWYNSSGHHDNYMRDKYNRGACAVYVYNGRVYAVENFGLTVTDGYSNGLNYESFPSYTASNGVILRINNDGSVCTHDKENPGMTSEMKEIVVNEYFFGLAVTDAQLNEMRTGSSTSTPSSSPLTETPEQSAPTQTETYEPTPEQANPTQTEPDTWVASNGVTVYVMNGNAYTIDDGYDDNAHYQAWLEYSQSH